MELKRLITHFTYRIAPKPEGGFIAHATDPTVPPLEAPTREELQQKIQADIAAGLAAEFPGLKLPLENQELKFAFHIECKPGGDFAIHSADPNIQSIEGATHEDIESHFAEKLIAFAGKHFMPELSQAPPNVTASQVPPEALSRSNAAGPTAVSLKSAFDTVRASRQGGEKAQVHTERKPAS